MLSIPPETQYGTTAIEGDARQMSIATVLSVLGMERRTGVFEVVSKKRRAQVEIVSGYVVYGTIGGTRTAALQALRLMLSWKVGRFSFVPLPPVDPPASLLSVQAMLLDAAKAEDEAAAGMPSSLRMFDGHFVTSFGGPPSRPDDTAPPSSRAMREAASAPVSLAFDIISSRRSEELVSVDTGGAASALAALERGWAGPASAPGRPAIAPPTKRPPPPAARTRPEAGASEDETISVDLGEVSVEASISASISVSLDDLEMDLRGAERMLMDEAPRAAASSAGQGNHGSHAGHRSTPTPPSGTPVVPVRRTAGIVPPPTSASARVQPLPAPPAPPRPARVPHPPRTHRSGPKKG